MAQKLSPRADLLKAVTAPKNDKTRLVPSLFTSLGGNQKFSILLDNSVIKSMK
jgi:hypothetical protein